MRKKFFLFIVGICIVLCLSCLGDITLKKYKGIAFQYCYSKVSKQMMPYLYTHKEDGRTILYEDIKRLFLPSVWNNQEETYYAMTLEEHGQGEQSIKNESEIMKDSNLSSDNHMGANDKSETGEISKSDETSEQEDQDSIAVSGGIISTEKKVIINPMKLQEYDYLRQNFYQVDNTTTIGSDQLDVKKLLGKDLTLKENTKGPQILIYHTHSQECYKDSTPGDPATSIVGVGDYLEELLETKYGFEVLHHKGEYDLPSRDNAYSNALPNIEEVLKQNPSIEVVIDLHRDGVPENRHFVTEINGKSTAKLMFFNGLSRTTAQGELSYLPNPYIADNLAFSFQMQLAAAEYFPDLTRKIYLKGYRYNLHLCPKSILVEVGAQNNTFEEAKNAMEPLAALLSYVLKEKS